MNINKEDYKIFDCCPSNIEIHFFSLEPNENGKLKMEYFVPLENIRKKGQNYFNRVQRSIKLNGRKFYMSDIEWATSDDYISFYLIEI